MKEQLQAKLHACSSLRVVHPAELSDIVKKSKTKTVVTVMPVNSARSWLLRSHLSVRRLCSQVVRFGAVKVIVVIVVSDVQVILQ